MESFFYQPPTLSGVNTNRLLRKQETRGRKAPRIGKRGGVRPSTSFRASELANRSLREADSRQMASCIWGLWPAVGHSAPRVPVQKCTFCSLTGVSRKVLSARWLFSLTAVQQTREKWYDPSPVSDHTADLCVPWLQRFLSPLAEFGS